jgi:RNA polymerase sigma-70 factor, ECF subfamily
MDDLRKIVEKAKKGDEEAFGFLYQTYYTPIYRYCRIRLPTKEDAEDVAQEVFMKGYRGFGTFNLRGPSALPFFYAIAKNSLVDYRRRKQLPQINDEGIDMPDHETPQTMATTEEDKEMVYRLLDKLTDNERDAIVMKFLDGLSNKEVAKIIGRSEESVRQLQSRGLRKLKSLYDRQ